MLLPSARRIEAVLGDSTVDLSVWQGVRSPCRVHERVIESVDGRFASLLDGVNALGRALDQLVQDGLQLVGARLDAVVADTWLVYQIVDVDLRYVSDRTATTTVTALLAEGAGVEPALLSARWQTIQPPARQLACAIGIAPLNALSEVVRRHRLRWGSLQGEFVASVNQHRSDLAGATAALAVMRQQGTQIGVFADGALKALHHEAGHPVPSRLKALGDSLLRRSGHEPDESMSYVGDSKGVVSGAPWLAPASAQ